MPTLNKRINISLVPDLEIFLSRISKRDNMPIATKAAHLIKIGLELEEDTALNDLANIRDRSNAKFLSHKKAWA